MPRTLRMEPVNGSPLVEFRLRDDGVQRRSLHPDGGYFLDGHPPQRADVSNWRTLTRAELLAYPSDGLVWEWLRELGITRPSPSGATIAEGDRNTRRVRIPLETYERAEELAEWWGCTLPEAIARAVHSVRG